MIPLIGIVTFAGLVALIRHVRQEQREFDASLDRQPAAAGHAPDEQSGEYVPIHELEF